MVGLVLIVVRLATFVPLFGLIPPMVMSDIAAAAFPLAREIPSTDIVRLDPVRAFIRRPRPVAVVPLVVLSLRIPVPLDPYEGGPWLGRHAVDYY